MSSAYVSGNLTEVYGCTDTIILKACNEAIKLKNDERDRIQLYWKRCLAENDTLFNGKVMTVQEIHRYDGKIVIDLFATDYAHLTYVMNHRGEEITACRSVAAGGLLITKDDYILLGKMGKKTSFPGIIQCIGGGISQEDIFGEETPVNTVIRECYEETGIRIKRNSVNCSKKYVYVRENMSTLGFCYIVKMDLRKGEVEAFFEQYEENNNELEKLIFVKNDRDEIKKFCEGNMLVDYLKPVLYDYANMCELNDIGTSV